MGDDPRFGAAVELLGRTAADTFQIRFDDSEEPTVWIAVAHWPERFDEDGRLLIPDHYDAAGGMTPWMAVFRLCEATMDGGTCRHCGKPTMVDDKPGDDVLVGLDALVCAYRYDPELNTFRRACEGVT